MALVLKDRVKVITTTTGTGTYTLGSTKTGFLSFSVIGDGNTTYYTVENGADWEVGIGTFTASGTTLSRDAILASSNSNAAVNWGAGNKDVFIAYPTERAVYVDGSSVFAANSAKLAVPNGGTGVTSLTANNVLLGNGTGAVQFVAPGTSGNVLVSNGTTWTSGTPTIGLDSGTRAIFAQTSAPTGWTKDTVNYDNHALKVTTGTVTTGGSADFTSAFTSQTPSGTVSVSGSISNTTISLSEFPNNSDLLNFHSNVSNTNVYFTSNGNFLSDGTLNGGYRNGGNLLSGIGSSNPVQMQIGGGGGSHGHSFSGSGSFSGNAINLAVKYLDVITATKD